MELSLDSPTNQAILTALRGGDLRRAAELLLDVWGGAVYRACSCIVAEAEAAAELCYGGLSLAFSRLASFRADESPECWLFEAAREHCCSEFFPQHPLEPAVVTLSGEGHAPSPVDVQQALNQLEETERALIGLAYGFGLPTMPFSTGELADRTRGAFTRLLSSGGAQWSERETVAAMREIHWHLNEPLRRRLQMLCGALAGT